MRYRAVDNYKKAEREKSIVLFNSYTSACIEMNYDAFDIFKYIEANTPSLEEIMRQISNTDIRGDEVVKLIKCLKETAFVYEVDETGEVYECPNNSKTSF